jgi:hypothetical protein
LYYHSHRFSKKLFKPRSRSLLEVIKYGTIQSICFLTLYVGGTALVTGFWHPVYYLRTLAMIKGKQIDNAVKFDPYVQEYFLFSMMSYFGLSKEMMVKAKYAPLLIVGAS